MYLKRIEIQGFKSFANKIVFDFHNGITGIVGPNGSGKSNVSDAVRWVLGEQSAKQLRGGNMQDVIFAGTELRKPLGFAYVAITMDNSDHKLDIDFEEITVSRRLFRSGESEYMINGSACRLKDISELFFDTGIGKDGYSIIGQGQVDKILNGKPEERRELFDEAAGITKFKRRKGLALKKLESERESLIRVNDIITELEKQVGPLERQAKVAKEFLNLREELKTYDVNSYIMEYDSISQNLNEYKKREKLLSDDLNDAKEALEKSKVDYENITVDLKKIDEELDEVKNIRSSTSIRLQEVTSNIEILKEQINSENRNNEGLSLRNENIDSDIEKKKRELESLEEEKAFLQKKLKEATETESAILVELEDIDKNTNELIEKFESLRQTSEEFTSKNADLRAKKERYKGILEQVRLRKSQMTQRLLESKTGQNTLEIKIAEEDKNLVAINDAINKAKAEREELKNTNESIHAEITRFSKVASDLQIKYQRESARLTSLKNIAERYDGYGNSIKKIMETRDRIGGIHGVVADIIITSKDYELAIETALGGRIQNIVIDSENTAKILIEYLKKNKYGRATFLPLTSVRNSTFSNKEFLKEKGVIGIASDLVEYDKAYQNLVGSLLGRIVVIDNIDNAIAFEKKFRYEYRVVTLDGESLSPGGSISGGAFKGAGNLLGRKREIDEVEAEISELLKNYTDANDKMEAFEEKRTFIDKKLDENRRNNQDLIIEKNNIEHRKSSLVEKLEEFRAASISVQKDFENIDNELLEIENETKILDNTLINVGEDFGKVGQDIESLEKEIQNQRTKREDIVNKLNSLKIEKAGISQSLEFSDKNVSRTKVDMETLISEKSGLKGRAEDIIKNINEKNLRIEEEQKTVQELSQRIEELKKKEEELTLFKDTKSKTQIKIFENRDTYSDRVSLLDRDLYRLKGQIEKSEERISERTNYMWNEYELTYNSSLELKTDMGMSLNDIRSQIQGLRTKIKALGNVNVNAISDYNEVSGRYELMKRQHSDILEAEGTLIKIIEELDMAMKRQFAEKFDEIANEFNEVFKELFGGGSGKLALEEQGDMLEAGIAIISQPPGKKLQNMMQLSGGEKALTAIALLFAIQNLKPSPFALLDEIEAALDDSNVDRFAKYLHKLTDHTQFIVITHRRGTMVSADRLYGITMQEKGVSTLVSVNLIENELDN
ncbi:chromosome segregation protein SMC [Lachnoanaerobaculum umeaense]|uniref:Chromosome partition protein Smc n=1 Tax=Lachnoanaerobaculum umeaense TaxID=617123 RepID=A0A385Q142_9FIRM|nr:chromosome segregation protein SMC [Lachnoanaerobaculum umeaense]AYA99896.1 chromosome segregation protein SMC [Lachnoanaerobaculum umeaense]PZW98330.1 condensin subunit Smc [Lachnoanaerobaculum umeaense]